jgi:hypothetical protein
MLNDVLYRTIIARTSFAYPVFTTPPASTCFSYEASRAVQTGAQVSLPPKNYFDTVHSPTKEINIPVVDARNSVRRGNLSTMKNATKPVENKDQRASTAFISV